MPPSVLIGGGLAAVAVIGLLVGLTLAGGDDGKKNAKADGQAASSSPAGQEKSKAPDPAEEQAKKLDALLGDSNNSRSAVIRSVERIKSCKALGKAASDLRAAAKQRNGLVTRLAQLKTDKIPGSAQLNASLESAWKSSAAADNHSRPGRARSRARRAATRAPPGRPRGPPPVTARAAPRPPPRRRRRRCGIRRRRSTGSPPGSSASCERGLLRVYGGRLRVDEGAHKRRVCGTYGR